MSQLQEIFNRIEVAKKEQKEIRQSYKESLANSHEYQKLDEELKTLKARKKEVEISIRSEFGHEFDKLDELKLDIETDTELLSDLAMSKLMKGEKVEVMDEKDNPYEPVFLVKFRRHG